MPPRSDATRNAFGGGVLGLALLLMLVAGCRSATVVPLRVRVASPLDLHKYSTFAVLPLVDRDDRLGSEVLFALSNMVRHRLEHVEGISLLGQSATFDDLEGEEITSQLLSDPEKVAVLGASLGVAAVVTGQVRYYVFNDIGTRPVQWWDYRYQRYVSDVETYLVRSHRVELDLRVVDTESGERIEGRVFVRRLQQPQSIVGVVVQEISGSSTVMLQMAEQAIGDFVRGIAPHFELEERVLVR